jgi:hypothetical protein
LYELILVLIGQALGVGIALGLYFLVRYHDHRQACRAYKTLRLLTQKELSDNLKLAEKLDQALRQNPEQLIRGVLPYPAFGVEGLRLLAGSPYCEALPPEPAATIVECTSGLRAFNELYYRLYFFLVRQGPPAERKSDSLWADDLPETDQRTLKTYLERVDRTRQELARLREGLVELLQRTGKLLTDYQPSRIGFLSFAWQLLAGDRHSEGRSAVLIDRATSAGGWRSRIRPDGG